MADLAARPDLPTPVPGPHRAIVDTPELARAGDAPHHVDRHDPPGRVRRCAGRRHPRPGRAPRPRRRAAHHRRDRPAGAHRPRRVGDPRRDRPLGLRRRGRPGGDEPAPRLRHRGRRRPARGGRRPHPPLQRARGPERGQPGVGLCAAPRGHPEHVPGGGLRPSGAAGRHLRRLGPRWRGRRATASDRHQRRPHGADRAGPGRGRGALARPATARDGHRPPAAPPRRAPARAGRGRSRGGGPLPRLVPGRRRAVRHARVPRHRGHRSWPG